MTVSYDTTWLAVSAVKNDGAALVAVSGNDSLSVGLNYVTVTVTAGNGTQKVYTLAVTRQAQNAAAQPTPDNRVDTTAVETPAETPDAGRTIFTAEGRTYTILDPALLSSQPPEGCALGEYALLGAVCRAYLPESGEYVVFYARPEGGEAGLYVYDTREETFQRYGLTAAAIPPASAPSETPMPSPAPESAPETPDTAEEIENLRWTVTVLAAAAAVLFIGAAVLGTLLIRSITRPVRKIRK